MSVEDHAHLQRYALDVSFWLRSIKRAHKDHPGFQYVEIAKPLLVCDSTPVGRVHFRVHMFVGRILVLKPYFRLRNSASGLEVFFFWGQTGPPRPKNLLQKVGGDAPHLLQWVLW